jgi:hypothetical protein
MSFGFADLHYDIRREIHQCRAAQVVVFAAVGNEGNRRTPAFPASMDGSVVRVFSTNGMVRATAEFNPTAVSTTRNFGFLGEHVQVQSAQGLNTRVSGTSIATSIAAAIAALLIDFSRRQGCAFLTEKLSTVWGMSAALAMLGTLDNGIYCFNPWSTWLDPSDRVAPDDNSKRRYICGTLDRAECL